MVEALLLWYRQNKRDLPWRRTRDPYAILISEVMLQQTQVDRVQPKYLAWLERWPTFAALASASLAEVIRAWQGLGYNRRALNLHRLAKQVVAEFGGKLPLQVEQLISLPGLGPYTARAICVFADDQPEIALDTNVRRLFQRLWFGREDQHRVSDETIRASLNQLIVDFSSAEFHHAAMDFGASICLSRQPKCSICPLFNRCLAGPSLIDQPLARSAQKTEPFLKSNRYARGQVLDLLRSQPLSLKELDQKLSVLTIEHKRVEKAVDQLLQEGLIVKADQMLSLPAA